MPHLHLTLRMPLWLELIRHFQREFLLASPSRLAKLQVAPHLSECLRRQYLVQHDIYLDDMQE